MTSGWMRGDTEALITVAVHSREKHAVSVEAVIDTGFDGFLSLPPLMIRSLGLIHCAEVFADLANGQEVPMDLFEADAEWEGQRVQIEVAELDAEPLLGMAMLRGFHLGIDVIDGGRVEIRPLSAEASRG